MKYSIIYADSDYNKAINYGGNNYYNFPITINFSKGRKFILPCGTSDNKTVKIKGNLVYFISSNSSLDYIAMTVIDLSDNSVQSCFLSSNDLNDENCMSYNLLEKGTTAQIKILSEYL